MQATKPDDHELLWWSLQENQAGLRIADIQIRLTPLEEVFMAVVHMTDTQHAQTTLTRM